MAKLFKSRKFKLTLGSLLTVAAAVLSGEITTAQAVQSAVLAVAANVVGIAVEDAGAKAAGK
jgi:formate/nitrite transporter FocA (FNT family)